MIYGGVEIIKFRSNFCKIKMFRKIQIRLKFDHFRVIVKQKRVKYLKNSKSDVQVQMVEMV